MKCNYEIDLVINKGGSLTLHRLSTEYMNWIIMIGVVLFVLEFVFFSGGLIFSALFAGILIYIGWKNFRQSWGKVLFWIGLIIIIFSILNMIAVRFLILVAIIMFIIHYIKKREESTVIKPKFLVHDEKNQEFLYRITPLFEHRFFGTEETEESPYTWRDINIHGGFGDRIVDLSNTVLLDETAVISIRHILGNIEIYVPYEVEVNIHHSALYGEALILGNPPEQMVNQTLSYKTEGYNTNKPRVKIITSLISGDIEVKRI